MTFTVTKDAAGVPLQVTDSSPATPLPANESAIAGALNLLSGLVASGKNAYPTVEIGQVAYGSVGTEGVHVAGTIYIADIFVPRNKVLTGVKVLNGATVGTDSLIAALYTSDGGAAVATSALAGTLSAGTDAFQTLAFTSTYSAAGPARYWIGIQCDGTTAKTRRIAAATYIDVLTKSFTGVFGTITALTVPSTFTADVGPVAYVY